MLTSSSFRIRRGAAMVTALGAAALLSYAVHAQGLVQGVQQGAAAGSKAAGPVGGVLGGVTGNNQSTSGPVGGTAQPAAAKGGKAKPAATAKAAKAGKPAPAVSELTSAQIIATSDANIERLKRELDLNPEQDKHWGHFTSAMHYLGQHGAERFDLRKARALRDPPDDIVEQMRNEAQFLYDRGADQRAVADAAEPLFAALDDRQKATFIAEMVRLSNERGLD